MDYYVALVNTETCVILFVKSLSSRFICTCTLSVIKNLSQSKVEVMQAVYHQQIHLKSSLTLYRNYYMKKHKQTGIYFLCILFFPHKSLRKVQTIHLISWCGNFVEILRFTRNSAKTFCF